MRHLVSGTKELLNSRSRRLYARLARRLVPDLEAGHLIVGGAGVRAQAIDQSGNLVDDFVIERTGQTIQMPFRQLIVFSTNLDPNELVDDAFLRRIQMKVEVSGPDERMFFKIFAMMAKSLGVPLDKDGFLYLLQNWYREQKRELQSVHPRDILKIIVSMAEYQGIPPRVAPETIDAACESYFVDSQRPKAWKSSTRMDTQELEQPRTKSGIQRLNR